MKTEMRSRYDRPLAVLFGVLSVSLVVLAFANTGFFHWAFARHQNQLSWYIRPLFLIPFCFFSYQRSRSGIAGTIFLMLTSMFWFPEPSTVSGQVTSFLMMEQEYLAGDWDTAKILITLLIPISLGALAIAFWKRSLWFGIAVLIFIALAKMVWSLSFGGVSGNTVIAPAILGLSLCIILIAVGFRKLEKKKTP